RGPDAFPCTCAVRSAGAGVPASFGADTGAASCSGGSATPTPEPSPPPPPPAPSRAEPEVYHPPVIHWDPRHIHPMVTRRMASQAATLSATEGEPRVSPVPSSVRDV